MGPAHAAAQRLCVVLSGGVFGGGGGVVAVEGDAQKLPETTLCNVEHSGVSQRGGVRHWLLYGTVNYPVDAGTLGIMNNSRMFPRRTAG